MFNPTLLRTLLAGVASLGFAASAMAAGPLQLQVYNPGTKSLFPVSSELITGAHDAVLIDAQFQRDDAEALVEKIRASGKKLTTVYISHKDPDFYFGLDVIQAAFPDAKIVATPQTVAGIKASKDGKLAHWGPILKGNAPKALVVPEPMQGDTITLEGQAIKVLGLDGPTPARTVVWIPSLKAVVGGVPVAANIHVWMADTQSPESRRDWITTLDRIEALKPEVVVPGHFVVDAKGQEPRSTASLAFTRDYVKAFETEAAQAKDAAALVVAMKKRYPELGESSSLDLGAKVIKGEMKWP
ncbi:Glyoxylase, beta-lactamase superfamily II [Paracidovorax valerianellae]|uniref:Glyoxylase, beta-lactamase superfamily II n=1 Tax=Paracidovorax valerianellae TaxID=187868 RepID=A0A1G6PZ48_9BURK|nr:Glyoxylase, beta-lactamase superfamily II [Paracidovorax valerianellae]